MKDIKIDGSDKIHPDAATAIEALRKAKKWKSIFTSATFKVSETADEITDAICCYATAEELAAHAVVYTPEGFEKDEKTGDLKVVRPASIEVTEAPRVTWTSPRAK